MVEGGAGKLYVTDGGHGGIPVIFHHGLGSDSGCWQGQLDHLRKTRRAIAFDARGHGKSERAARVSAYTVEALADDLDRVVVQRDVARFWLVAHSFSGVVASAYAASHPERLAGIVYVDAVGDFTLVPPKVVQFFAEKDKDMTEEKLQAAFAEMLGAKARPGTRTAVLASAAALDVPAFAALRKAMAGYATTAVVAKFSGPKWAIDADGNDNPYMASHLPGVQRRTVSGVSHWMMLDDPEMFNATLDEVLK